MRGWLTHNLGLKLLSLFLATGLWFFVAGQSSVEVGFFVPLGFSGIPEDMVMTTAPTGEIAVRVRGPKLVINNLTPSKITVGLDLSSAKEGLNKYRIELDNIAVPTGVTVTGVKPRYVQFRLERLMRKAVAVRPRLKGRPAKGFRVGEVTVSPKIVEAAGLKKHILPIRRFNTEFIDITGLSESQTFKVKVDLGQRDVRSVSPEVVKVFVTIEKVTKKPTARKKTLHRKATGKKR